MACGVLAGTGSRHGLRRAEPFEVVVAEPPEGVELDEEWQLAVESFRLVSYVRRGE